MIPKVRFEVLGADEQDTDPPAAGEPITLYRNGAALAAGDTSPPRNTLSCSPTSAFSVIDCSICWRAWYLPPTALSLTKAWMKPLQDAWRFFKNRRPETYGDLTKSQ